ncbi:DUF6383 domain-containing protein [Parabacteroides sp. AF48-14]|uniref:DUF6383 domain-containing protein n=1 Tax=Parabacteroides sp. AF48-14 TaxID=2292052 RepID=UPI0026D822E0|nr:DUF6383 domain-containing protein [Parabacteroides sp. AF48-14]
MNKRFSTLLAAALVAGGLSFNANAAAYGADDVKDGSFIHLGASTDVLSVNDDSEFGLQSTSTWTGNVDKLLGTLWQVKKTPHATSAGVQYTYSFVNRLSGQMLSIKLQSVDGVKRENIKANEKQGQTDWAWDQTAGLYCVKNFGADKDSVFQLGFTDKGIQLSVKAGNAAPSVAPTSPTKALTQVAVSTAGVTLNASDFNALVKANAGRLFFTDENVSSTEKNVLTANKWEAVDAKMTDGAYASSGTSVLFLTNGKEYKNRLNDAMTAADKTQKEYLLVDYNFYDPSKEFNVLKVDTIAVEPTSDAVSNFDKRTVIAKHHPATAAFTVTYYIPNDSMVIAPAYVQTSIPVATTLDAMHTALPTDGKIDAVKIVVDYLKAGVTLFSTKDKATEFPGGTKFAEVKQFTEAGASGSAKTGQDLIDAVKKAIKEITYSKDAAEKKKQEAYVAAVNKYLTALDGLVITTVSKSDAVALVSTSAIKDGANYADGLNSLTVAAVSPAKQVVIRKLSNTKVLTIGQITSTTETHGNLIATIKTSDKDATIGGDAEIAEGLYYVIDAMKEESASVANKYYGLYFDESPVNAANYVAKAQAFNPYVQFVVSKAAGVDKGNYTIENRATADAKWQGVTNVVDKDNNIFAINGDTIQLVAADDVDEDNAYIGFKYITANDAKNNKFTITSAADVLAGQTIVMVKDSSLKIAEGEMLFTLTPSAEAEYGVNEDLINVSYTIYNDADSTYLVKKDGNYRFIHESNIAADDITEFYMIAVDTDSTYVLADGLNAATKMVISTQYKTISAKGLGERNDMFIVKPQSAPASYKSLPKHVRIQAINGDYAAVNAKNQGIAVREGDLKADAYDNLDFIFWLDTAHYENAAPYTYYITKGVKATEEVAASRLYMWNSVDSAAAKDANKELPYVYGAGANRVMFRTASIMAQDTLLVPTMDAAAKIDTVSIAAKPAGSADGLKHNVKAGVKNFQFSFEFASKDADNEYNIVCQNNNGKNYVHNINGVLAMGPKEDAVVVNVLNVTPEDEAATGNETINAEGVTVIAANGGVQIIGAQGKKVVITNILGQTVANTVITSDNATIAAPQGVVVVAIEGEEAVKAIVK